jgi:type I restriction enzyme S subunit
MLPEGWKETQPANIVTFFNGFAFRSTDTTDKGIKWIKITNVLPGGISWKECNYLPIDFCKEYSDFLVKKGDIVVALTRPIINNHLKIGRLENEDDLSLLNQRIAKLVPKNGNYLNYIYHLFRSDDFSNKIQKALMGTDPPNLSMSVLKRFLLPLPPLPEQKKIAAILSTWDCAIEGTEKLLANSQQQKKALMQQLLTGKKRLPGFSGEWKKHRLSDCCHVVMGSSPKSEFYNETGEGLPLLQGNADIKNRFSCPRIFTSEITKECQLGDILLSVRAPVGTVSIALHHACIGRGISSIRVKKGNSQEFAYQYFLSIEDRWERLAQGSTFEAVNGDDIKKLTILLPPLPEQKAIAAVLTTADEEITAIESDLSCLRQEKKALMQQLLTGKRRVTVD